MERSAAEEIERLRQEIEDLRNYQQRVSVNGHNTGNGTE